MTATPIKALTIRQPWAYLIFNGAKCSDIGNKDIENRTHFKKHRGLTAIHTSKKVDMDAYDHLVEQGIKLPPASELPCGQIIGTVNIVDCVKEHASRWKEKGTWGYVLEDARELDNPVACKGQLGFWDCSHLFSGDVVEFEILETNINRRARGTEWIRVRVFENGVDEGVVWMDIKDIKRNKEKFGDGCFKNKLEDVIKKEADVNH
ncbi:MAG: ASCH domain-containing protein [Campylobacterales bacterium]|nr:ASCH domain-containing protein [Campylobacterales bacterium]